MREPATGCSGSATRSRDTLLREYFELRPLLDSNVISITPRSVPLKVVLSGETADHVCDFSEKTDHGLALVDVRCLAEMRQPNASEFHLAVAAAAREQGFSYRVETEETILAEPSYTNALLVQSCKRRFVYPSDQVLILHHLSESGQSTLIEAAQACRPHVDGISAVLALACRRLVIVDLLSEPLGPETPVKRHR